MEYIWLIFSIVTMASVSRCRTMIEGTSSPVSIKRKICNPLGLPDSTCIQCQNDSLGIDPLFDSTVKIFCQPIWWTLNHSSWVIKIFLKKWDFMRAHFEFQQTLPKAQRNQGLSSTYQSKFLWVISQNQTQILIKSLLLISPNITISSQIVGKLVTE